MYYKWSKNICLSFFWKTPKRFTSEHLFYSNILGLCGGLEGQSLTRWTFSPHWPTALNDIGQMYTCSIKGSGPRKPNRIRRIWVLHVFWTYFVSFLLPRSLKFWVNTLITTLNTIITVCLCVCRNWTRTQRCTVSTDWPRSVKSRRVVLQQINDCPSCVVHPLIYPPASFPSH